jgi:hypothetical protein
VGEDTGDRPGELQFRVERDHLDRNIAGKCQLESGSAPANGK